MIIVEVLFLLDLNYFSKHYSNSQNQELSALTILTTAVVHITIFDRKTEESGLDTSKSDPTPWTEISICRSNSGHLAMGNISFRVY